MNRVKILFIINYFILNSLSGFCQNWQKLGNGVWDSDVRAMFADTIDNKIYVGGTFLYADSILVNHIAVWDGTKWDSLGAGSKPGYPCYAITRYRNEIYATGNFYYDAVCYHEMAHWNGVIWDTTGLRVEDGGFCFIEKDSNLHIANRCCNNYLGVDSNDVSVWDGTTLTPMNIPIRGPLSILKFYNNELYLGGTISNLAQTFNFLARWDGTNLMQVGTGIQGNFSGVGAMEIYNNELYIGGYFFTSSGNVENCIVKWDGNTLQPVGGGMNGAVLDLKVINGYLYACGAFTIVGGQPVSYMAKWDGNTWSPVSNDTINFWVWRMAVLNNELYIAGSFTMINGDTVNRVAKYTHNLALREDQEKVIVNLYPNPSKDYFTFAYTFNKLFHSAQLKLYSAQGVEVGKWELENSKGKNEIDVSELSAGVYFYVVIADNKNSSRGKIIIMH